MTDALYGGKHEVVLAALGMTKHYGAQVALNSVDFRVRRGAVNVLIGENGAGKSTLMRLISGAEEATAGHIVMEGRTLNLRSPRHASAVGIAIVYQELTVFDNLDVVENIFAGREMVHKGVLIDRERQEQRSGSALKSLGMSMDSREIGVPAGNLSLGCRQLVEVARSLADGAKVLILDEPTSALTANEADSLYRVIDDLRSRGVAIVYISHRLHELLHLGDYFTVLRDGRVVGEGVRSQVDRAWIVERMSGRSLDMTSTPAPARSPEPALQVTNLSARHSRPAIEDVTFTVGKGEVFGIYGLLGSGRTELLETLAGVRRPDAGEVKVRGATVTLKNVAATIRAGMVLVSEDRQKDGLVPHLSIRENISLSSLREFSRYGLLSRADQLARVRETASLMQISATDLELPVTTLSGGNQQKVVLARCLMSNPSVLLLDEPTRGVDVRAKADIYRVLRQLATKGLSILFTSSELEETRLLADRVVVIAGGRISAEFAGAELSDESLFAAASPALGMNP